MLCYVMLLQLKTDNLLALRKRIITCDTLPHHMLHILALNSQHGASRNKSVHLCRSRLGPPAAPYSHNKRSNQHANKWFALHVMQTLPFCLDTHGYHTATKTQIN